VQTRPPHARGAGPEAGAGGQAPAAAPQRMPPMLLDMAANKGTALLVTAGARRAESSGPSRLPPGVVTSRSAPVLTRGGREQGLPAVDRSAFASAFWSAPPHSRWPALASLVESNFTSAAQPRPGRRRRLHDSRACAAAQAPTRTTPTRPAGASAST